MKSIKKVMKPKVLTKVLIVCFSFTRILDIIYAKPIVLKNICCDLCKNYANYLTSLLIAKFICVRFKFQV